MMYRKKSKIKFWLGNLGFRVLLLKSAPQCQEMSPPPHSPAFKIGFMPTTISTLSWVSKNEHIIKCCILFKPFSMFCKTFATVNLKFDDSVIETFSHNE